MEKINLKEMKGSAFHKIMAVVLEVMEKVNFEPQKNVELQESKEPGVWQMVFTKEKTDITELNDIKTQLGSRFEIKVKPATKAQVCITLEAPAEDYMMLLEKKADKKDGQQEMFHEQQG